MTGNGERYWWTDASAPGWTQNPYYYNARYGYSKDVPQALRVPFYGYPNTFVHSLLGEFVPWPSSSVARAVPVSAHAN